MAPLRSITVTGFRSLRTLRVDNLTRVNLFVGTNNSGKTSLLEAVELLSGRSSPAVLLRGPGRREETAYTEVDEPSASDRSEVSVSHLFHGHSIGPGATFSIKSETAPRGFITCTIERSSEQSQSEQAELLIPPSFDRSIDALDEVPPLTIRIATEEPRESFQIPLTPRGGVTRSERRRFFSPAAVPAPVPVRFLSSDDPGRASIARLWDSVVLTPDEGRVVQALQIIEPTLERIATVGRDYGSEVFIKLAESSGRLPIGSMGDGVRRLLFLSLSLLRSAGGVLLVDEIDTGLHYSTMTKMWEIVVETALDLGCQVFAATHSLDCVRSIAALYERDPSIRDVVSLHRVERGSEATISYSAEEIATAARQNMELR